MNEISEGIASEINRLHQLAAKTATEAMGYAKAAGLLLIEIKAQLPHGQFGRWVDENIAVSQRQVQRYLAVAEGKMLPVRSLSGKYDTVSYLNHDASSIEVALPPQMSDADFMNILMDLYNPSWIPKLGHWYIGQTDHGVYWVVPDHAKPSLFHVSRLYDEIGQSCEADEGSLCDGTRWPIEASRVAFQLKRFQLPDPSKIEWYIKKKVGLDAPFGTPENHGKFKVVGKDGRETWLPEAF